MKIKCCCHLKLNMVYYVQCAVSSYGQRLKRQLQHGVAVEKKINCAKTECVCMF